MQVSFFRSLAFVAAFCFGVSAAAQGITWSPSEIQDPGTSNVGGGNTQRPTIASAVINGRIYIAYTTKCGSGPCPIAIKSTSGQQSGGAFTFTSNGTLSVPSIGTVSTNVNPALGVQNGVAYIAWTDQNGKNWMAISTDMSSWSGALQIPTVATAESIGLSFDPANSSVTVGYATTSTYGQYPDICSVTPNLSNFPFSSVGCYTSSTSGTQMLYNPGIVWAGGPNAYMFLTWHGSSHCLSSFYGNGNDPWTYWNPYDISGHRLCASEQTSSAPDPVWYNGSLWVAFRSNDSSAAFDMIAFNDNQANWSRIPTGGYHMDGSPDLLPLSTAQGISLTHPLELVNFYARNGYLYSVFGY
jgi:hypothetical protein